MASYEVSIGFWAIGYTFHAFYGPFLCLSSRELQSTILEDKMTHFVNLTVPTPCTDHSLRHSTTRHGFFYRPKITDISEISHISVGSDKIRYLLNFSYFSYFTQTTQIQPHNNLVLIMFYSSFYL
jgi:hypothetical protein